METLIHHWWDYEMVWSLWKPEWWILNELEVDALHDPAMQRREPEWCARQYLVGCCRRIAGSVWLGRATTTKI